MLLRNLLLLEAFVEARRVVALGLPIPGAASECEKTFMLGLTKIEKPRQSHGKYEETSVSEHGYRLGPAPGLLLQIMEARSVLEHSAAVAMVPLWRAAAKGDGHPVLVLPGLTAGDGSTSLMRRFLKSRGFSPYGWGQGRNLGLRDGVIERAHGRLCELWRAHGRSVSLVGWSLGGLYARELAKHSPELVRLVVTLGSPFTGHPRETNAWRLYEFASGHRVDWHDFNLPLRWAPPVPTTSIWSQTDGVVAWRCSVEPRQTLAENIVVESSHLGLGAHPATLYAVADRLAQPEGRWAPFHRKGWRRFVYSDPERVKARLKTAEAHVHAHPVAPHPSPAE
jgi:pimeloyl-ACP methyl ester carboxylesterase